MRAGKYVLNLFSFLGPRYVNKKQLLKAAEYSERIGGRWKDFFQELVVLMG
jgi:hypothetical protein